MISIITATYNREKYLSRVYSSLKRQTNKNFEWLVIDDGSVDDTQSVVEGFIESEKDFEIYYYKQENGGRHRAVNNGVKKAHGDYCLLLDSDDYLTDNAISLIYKWIDSVDDDDIVGVSGLRIYENGKCTNDVVMDSHFCDLKNYDRYKVGLNNDCAETYRKDILLKYPFPEFEGENFISEVASWNKIACDGYKVRWYFTPIYVCEYLDSGLTKNIKQKQQKNPEGVFYIARLSKEYLSFGRRLKGLGYVSNVMKEGGFSYKYIANKIGCSTFVCFFLSLIYRIKHLGA